jgi:membrane-bound lytic murein transglycosylase B
MTRVRAAALALVAAAGCAAAPPVALERAQAEAQAGRPARALQRFDAIAARKDVSDTDRIDAFMGAAHACDALQDVACARVRLERAVERDIPGKVEPALFELAERVVQEDRGRALSLYYRAAGGAEKYRERAWPYKAAMDRILQISMSR